MTRSGGIRRPNPGNLKVENIQLMWKSLWASRPPVGMGKLCELVAVGPAWWLRG